MRQTIPAASRRTVLACVAAGIASPALGQGRSAPEGRTLTIATAATPTSIDPQFYNAGPNTALSSHMFERLIERDPVGRLLPGLAQSWRPVSETVWECQLRPGVKWHDGRDFTADDVAFSFARIPNVPNSPGNFAGFIRGVTVEVAGPLLVRLHTARPDPMLPIQLGSVFIVSRHAGEGATTEDYNSGRAAIGTGPYRLLNHVQNDRTEMVRFDQYWGPAEPWARVNYRTLRNNAARTAALLSGDVDVIDQVPTADLPTLRRDARVTLTQIPSLRVMYLAYDFSRQEAPRHVTDNEGRPLARNPFLDIRVRRALSFAINRTGLCDQVMEGTATPTGQWLPPGAFSYNPDIRPTPYDPAAARQLLAEAGYPDGFRMTLHTPNDRYPNDARTAQAVVQMWTRIGVRTQVEARPWATFSNAMARQEFDARLGAWGSPTVESSYLLVQMLMTFNPQAGTGAFNSGRYSNPTLDALVDRAGATVDDAERERLQREAAKLALDDEAFTPLFQFENLWATRRGIRYTARADDRTVAREARPA